MKRLELTIQMNDEAAFKMALYEFITNIESDGVAIVHESRFIDLETPILVSGNRVDQFIKRHEAGNE